MIRPQRWPRSALAWAVAALLAAPGVRAQPAEPLTLRESPRLAEKPPEGDSTPAYVSGDKMEGRPDLETVLEGNAELRRPGLTVRADRLEFDQTTDTARVHGNVRANAMGNRYTATSGALQVDSFEGFLLQPTYELLKNGAHGTASRIDFLDADRAIVRDANYTTCRRDGPNWMPGWLLRARSLELDTEEDVGRAEGAVLDFKGVPILPLPAVSFPLSERRKSGWLPPTIGLDSKSGLDLSVPYYWNIAPNRDATITPGLLTKRGVDVAGEFRYKESDYAGLVQGNVLPGDRLNGRTRWGYAARHSGTFGNDWGLGSPLGLNVNLNRVSDDDYWKDFTRRGLSLTTRLLANDATLSWAHGDWSASARALKWQTLQDPLAPILPPYDRLPQLAGRWARTDWRGFDASVDLDFTRFRADPLLTGQPNADRVYGLAQVSYPWVRPWGFVKPKLQLHATQYSFDRALSDGRTAAGRVLPTFSLDSGLVFERDAQYFGRAFRQTLEPRLFYVNTPYRDQSAIPVYDTGAYDFNFATVFTENAFAGQDRIADNNQLTFGLTSRLLDPDTGAEAVRLGIAQRYRFDAQRVTLPGGTPYAKGLSDLLLGASVHWNPRWSFDSVVQYNPETHTSTRATVGVRYSPRDYHTISVAHRRARDLGSNQWDIGWQWPLNDLWGDRANSLGPGKGEGPGRWYSVGRLNYSQPDKRFVDALLGLEYDAGCWIGRIVVERLQSTVMSSTKRIMFQLEFVGFSRIGSNPLRSLRNNIPRYQFLREEITSPSRFTAYD